MNTVDIGETYHQMSGADMIENLITYRYLQCFIEIVCQNSFTRAADVLALTQSAVSKKLKELKICSTFS